MECRIFVWNVRTLVESIRQFVPQIAGLKDRMVPADGKMGEPADTVFPACEKISIDYAVMEKYPNVCTIPADVQWADLGNWTSLYEKLPKDENGQFLICHRSEEQRIKEFSAE